MHTRIDRSVLSAWLGRALAIFAWGLGLPLTATEPPAKIEIPGNGNWLLSGEGKYIVRRDNQLVLPANTGLSREFPNRAILVRLVTRPVFSESVSEWPILAVGPAGVAFAKKGGSNQLVLVVGEDKVVEVPLVATSNVLGSEIDLMLAYDPVAGDGAIAVNGGALRLFEGARSTGSVEVAISSGQQVWPIDSLRVLTLPDEDEDSVRSRIDGNRPQKPESNGGPRSAIARLLANASVATTGSTSPTPAKASAGVVSVSTLEVFTPPSVRNARVEAVRSIVAKDSQK